VNKTIQMMFQALFLQFGSQTVVMSKLNNAVSLPISIAVDWNVSLDCGENCTLQITNWIDHESFRTE
jgi:hypothetical protein